MGGVNILITAIVVAYSYSKDYIDSLVRQTFLVSTVKNYSCTYVNQLSKESYFVSIHAFYCCTYINSLIDSLLLGSYSTSTTSGYTCNYINAAITAIIFDTYTSGSLLTYSCDYLNTTFDTVNTLISSLIVNSYSTLTTSDYSCNYINGLTVGASDTNSHHNYSAPFSDSRFQLLPQIVSVSQLIYFNSGPYSSSTYTKFATIPTVFSLSQSNLLVTVYSNYLVTNLANNSYTIKFTTTSASGTFAPRSAGYLFSSGGSTQSGSSNVMSYLFPASGFSAANPDIELQVSCSGSLSFNILYLLIRVEPFN